MFKITLDLDSLDFVKKDHPDFLISSLLVEKAHRERKIEVDNVQEDDTLGDGYGK